VLPLELLEAAGLAAGASFFGADDPDEDPDDDDPEEPDDELPEGEESDEPDDDPGAAARESVR